MLNTWVGLVNNVSADGTALTASVAETSIISALHKYTLPANFCDTVGKKFRVTAFGRVSNVVTTPGTLTLRLKFGSIAVFTSGAMSINIVAKTNVGWKLDLLCEVRSIGISTAATVFGQGTWASESVIGAGVPTATGCGVHVLPYNTAPVVGAGFDSTASQVLDLTAQWSISNANSILCHLLAIEALN
jgi:hypothetical protein